jgi:hypothetical protein
MYLPIIQSEHLNSHPSVQASLSFVVLRGLLLLICRNWLCHMMHVHFLSTIYFHLFYTILMMLHPLLGCICLLTFSDPLKDIFLVIITDTNLPARLCKKL